jgi:hypothetical protein
MHVRFNGEQSENLFCPKTYERSRCSMTFCEQIRILSVLFLWFALWGCRYLRLSTVQWLVNDELESIWIQVVLASQGTILAFAWRGWKRTRKYSARAAGISVQIRKEHLTDASVKRYHYTRLLGNCPSKAFISSKWLQRVQVSTQD